MFVRSLSLPILAALLAAPLAAADKSAKNTQNDKNRQNDKNQKNLQLGQKGDLLAGFNLPKGVELSPDQLEKFKAIKAEVAPKLTDLQTQVDAIVTKERKAAQAAAMQKAKAEGKDKRGVNEAGQQALGLKDDEAAKLKQLGLQRGTIVKEVQQQLQSLLTAEQKAKLAELKKGKGVDKNAKPEKGAKPGKGTQPDKNANPLKAGVPDKGTKGPGVKNAKPDKGKKPGKGTQPDKSANPLKGGVPDKGTKGPGVDKNAPPDKGKKPGKGTQPDKNANPIKGSVPDNGTKNGTKNVK